MPRTEPTNSTKFKLLALSGNRCAFPECENNLVDEEGHLIGQFCHIEAAAPGGERYNPDQTNDERRDFDNLIMLCANHHIVTNDVSRYDVDFLKQMKRTHEKTNIANPYNPPQVTLEEINAVVTGAVRSSVASSGFAPYGDTEYQRDMQAAQQSFNNDMHNISVMTGGNQSALQQASIKIKPKYDQMREKYRERKVTSDKMYKLRLEELEEEFEAKKRKGLEELNERGMLHSGQKDVLTEKIEREKDRALQRLNLEFGKE